MTPKELEGGLGVKTGRGCVLVSCGTGGAEIMVVIEEALKEKGITVKSVVLTEHAERIHKEAERMGMVELKEYILRREVDIVVNETSNYIDIQREVTRFCKEVGVRNVSMLDYYGNMTERYKEVPDLIIAPSESAKKEVEAIGIKEVVVGGNPAFDRVRRQGYVAKREGIKRVAYISQGRETQKEEFGYVYRKLEEKGEPFKLEIKKHPQMDKGSLEWETIIKGKEGVEILGEVRQWEKGFKDYLREYDIVVGYNSTLQMKAYLEGVPTIFLELGDVDEAIERYSRGEGKLQEHPKGDFVASSTERVVAILLREVEKTREERGVKNEDRDK